MVKPLKVAKALGVLLSVWWTCATCAFADTSIDQPESRIEIRRTADGIPHILAQNWYDLGYGYGYAQTEDTLCTLAEAFVTFRGRRAYFFGANSRPQDDSTFGRWRNLELDFFFRAFADDLRVAEYRGHQPPELIRLIEGFAEGYNRYLRDARHTASSGFEQPCLREPWIQEINAEDIFRRAIAMNLAAGYAKFIPEIVNASPPAVQEKTPLENNEASAATLSARLSTSLGGITGLGSNLIAFGRQATGTESGVLFGNPHWFWGGPDRFYQAQLTIPGKLNVAGVSFLGYPVIMIGFNEQVAWSHTVSTARRVGLYEISLDSSSPIAYRVDGATEAMRPVSVTVETRGADGRPVKVTRTLYRTRFGPVIELGAQNSAFGWSTGRTFAIRDVNENNFNVLRNFFYWNQSRSLDEFVEIQRREAGPPWINTGAVGGKDGRVWFSDIGAMPNIPDVFRQRCASPLGQTFANIDPYVPFLDGTRSSCEWAIDPHAVHPGAVAVGQQPQLLREDYIANMNDSYWSSNPRQPLEGYPSAMGDERKQLSLRTRLGHHIAHSLINDGEKNPAKLGKRLQAAALNARVYSAELFKKPVIEHICRMPEVLVEQDALADNSFSPPRRVKITEACKILQGWPDTGNSFDRGALLWDAFWARLEKIPPVELYRIPFSADAPLETPNALKVDDPRVAQALGAAIIAISETGLAVDTPRGNYLYARSGDHRIALYGGCEDMGYFTIACNIEGGYEMGRTSIGNTYMQIVHFGPEGVEAHTMLAHGLNDSIFGREANGQKDNGLYRYAKKNWLRFPFREEAIMRDPKLKRVILYP
jgi:acyl-homoserine-lactone acylase